MIKGIGGVFLYSENPKTLATWYESNLGLKYEYTEEYKAYFITFPHREMGADKKRYSIFSILHSANRPFVDGKFFTINLRVEGLAEMISKLQSKNIQVKGPEHHDEGSFAWINDPEGNYIELWEDLA